MIAGDGLRTDAPNGDTVVAALRDVTKLLASAQAQEDLRTNPKAFVTGRGWPVSTAPLLLNILNLASVAGEPRDGGAGERPPGESQDRDSSEVRDMLMEPFAHITWTFRILTAMSVTMFIVGLGFMLIALFNALKEQSVSQSTFLIAGLGLADLVVLFYRRPWEDISRGLSNSQQARMIATSYLSGVSMIRRDDPKAQATLMAITRESVELLEQFTEPSVRVK